MSQLSLFGDASTGMKKPDKGQGRDEVFNDYEGFVAKFEAPKTTDDCFTPPEVYECVRAWVDKEITPLSGRRIVRPFYPGGDYQSAEYLPGDIVIDNPPFSILSKIVRYYAARKIDFFLFAPGLTLFKLPQPGCTYIVAGASITYDNKAAVNTSFITNCMRGVRIAVRGDLSKAIKAAQEATRSKDKRKIYDYPPNVVTAALLNKVAHRGVCFSVSATDCEYVRNLDAGATLFGGGYLLSDSAAAERAAAERAAAERAAAERAAAERAAAERAAASKWQLSEREKRIINQLNKQRETD